MWQSLRTNDIQMVSTDHCPFCMKDQKGRGIEDFSKMDYRPGKVTRSTAMSTPYCPPLVDIRHS